MPIRELRPGEEVIPLERERNRPRVRALRPDESIQPLAGGDTMEALVGRAEQARQDVNQQTRSTVETLNRAGQEVSTGILAPLGSGVREAASRVGITRPPGEEAEDATASALRLGGEAVGLAAATAAPFLRGPSLTAQAQRFLQQAVSGRTGIASAAREGLRRSAESVATQPVRTLGMEGLIGGAAGAGGAVTAQGFGDTPLTRAFGELLGGGAAVAGTAGLRSGVLTPVATAARRTVRSFREFGPTRGRERAAERVQRAVEDPERTLRAADEAEVLEEAPLTVGERAEEPGLLSLERAVVQQNEQLSRQEQERFADINELIQRSTRETAEAGDATPEQMRQYLEGLMDTRIEQATARAQERLRDLGPEVGREDANRLARNELERALGAAREQERALWQAVPEDIPAPLQSTQSTYREMLNRIQGDRVLRGQNLIPARVRRLLGRVDEEGEFMPGELSGTVRMGELKSLRTEIRQAAERERAKPAPNRQRLSLLRDLESSLLTDMQAAGPEAGEALDMARAFSADLNERFTRGPVGRLLGFDVQGAPSTTAGQTLETTVGSAGAGARESTDALLRAVERSGDQPEMRRFIEEFLVDDFLRRARRSGEFDPQAAQGFLASRQNVLARFPELRRRLEGAVASGRGLQDVQALRSPARSAAAVFLNAPPGQEVQKVIRSRDPAEAARQMREMLQTDPTGQALAGGRKALVDHVLERSTTRATDTRDQPIVSGRAMREVLSDRGFQEAASELLTPEQLGRLNRIRNTAIRLDRARQAAPAGEVISDRPGIVMDTLMRIGLVRLGRLISSVGPTAGSGGDIQTPSLLVRFGERLQKMGLDPARRLIADAVTSEDNQLMRALLTDVTGSPERARFVRQQLNAWAVASARELGIQELERAEQEREQ